MISLRRLSLVILLASLANTVLLTIVFRDTEALLDGAALNPDYWMLPPFAILVGVEFFSLAWTAAGLLLIMAICILAIPRRVSLGVAKLVFIAVGMVVGWGLFGLLLEAQLWMTVFGTVSAFIFVLICPNWFAAWDTSALAES